MTLAKSLNHSGILDELVSSSEDRKQKGKLSPICWRIGFIAKHLMENCPQDLITTKATIVILFC